MARAPSPRVAMETGSAAEMPEFKASIDFTTEMTMAMLTASRVRREAAASLTGASRHDGLSGDSSASARDCTKATKASPIRMAPAIGIRRAGIRSVEIEGVVDGVAARERRHRSDEEDPPGRQELLVPRGMGRGPSAASDMRGDVATPEIQSRGDAEGDPEQEQVRQGAVSGEQVRELGDRALQGPQVARDVGRDPHPEIGAHQRRGPLEQPAGEGGAPAVGDLVEDLVALHEQRLGEALGLVDFGDGVLALRALLGDVLALLAFLGLGPELVQALAGRVEARLHESR